MLFAGLLVLTVEATWNSRWRRLLEATLMRAMGKYSYAIYVLHPVILIATVEMLLPGTQFPAYVAKPAILIWTLTASFAAAWLSYHLYEKHFLRLKRYFAYREPVDKPASVPLSRLSYIDA